MENKMIDYTNISFDKEHKTFTILEGSEGTYPYTEIKKCDVVYESASFRGKAVMFFHKVLVSFIQPPTLLPQSVYAGIKITMVDNTIYYVYISKEKQQLNTLDFYEDKRKAEEVQAFIKRIIDKYQSKKIKKKKYPMFDTFFVIDISHD